ncbi:MAG: hypothetical protein U0Y82_15025 [Thermoleophilia bacterium]
MEDLFRAWLRVKSAQLSPNHISNVDVDYRMRIGPAFGRHTVRALSRHRVEIFLAHLAETATSRRMIVGTIASCVPSCPPQSNGG